MAQHKNASRELVEAPSAVQHAPLDLAWERINALGGVPSDDFDKGIDYAVGEALKIIEALGGCDPLIRAVRTPMECIAKSCATPDFCANPNVRCALV